MDAVDVPKAIELSPAVTANAIDTVSREPPSRTEGGPMMREGATAAHPPEGETMVLPRVG
jgi:hypothetical protein